MERHKCKLCTRSFVNGRALGGHMKAHLSTLPLPKKTQQFVDATIESASSASLAEEVEKNRGGGGGGGEEKGLVYGLRENPKKSFRVADPEFSSVADAGSCVFVQDGESETESRNPTRRRSKRNRKFENQKLKLETKKAKQSSKQSWINNNNNGYSYSSPADPEPVSSVSDTTPEEDVAMCLMMLSRDCWMKEQGQRSVEISEETKLSKKIRCCEKCNKGFRSLQALGEHKRICEGKVAVNEKIFKCPFCFKIFGSGQALGGHKRSHILASSTATRSKLDAVSIDLNLPARAEEHEYSVVSDA
ncbi:hypothetical protein HS088_TW20G00211 [Tripterygium wilfordii]|uniref:C2H2-type domain-containing protein n=1 Tax=Tripterygium wilfordii TaxID=458696 RepID=A0A7J7C7V5_TRIWF|nr:zinc finger protein ZAT1 [Tripterygium wilfordii]KAF5729846.1 hypothetical protein HS088_TW20G00211 [Tripterygium wilfordii]